MDDDGNVLPAEDIQLAVGQLYLSEVSTYYAAEQVIVHPGYDSWTMENDIALIRLAQALPESAPTLSLNDDPRAPCRELMLLWLAGEHFPQVGVALIGCIR